MKIRRILCFTVFTAVLTGVVHSQVGQNFPVTPSHPTDFERENVGSGLSGVGIIEEPKASEKIRVSFTAVSPLREWRNAKGVVIRGHLIAFEPGDHSDSDQPLTLISDGKVRLLVQGKNNFNVLPLTVLSKADQEYIVELAKVRGKSESSGE